MTLVETIGEISFFLNTIFVAGEMAHLEDLGSLWDL